MASPTRPLAVDAEPVLQEFADNRGNCVGGSLHIVLEDLNLKDRHIRFCIDRARSEGDELGVRLGGMMLAMSMSQRKKVVRRWDEIAPSC